MVAVWDESTQPHVPAWRWDRDVYKVEVYPPAGMKIYKVSEVLDKEIEVAGRNRAVVFALTNYPASGPSMFSFEKNGGVRWDIAWPQREYNTCRVHQSADVYVLLHCIRAFGEVVGRPPRR